MRDGVKGHFREGKWDCGRVSGSHVTGNGCDRKSRGLGWETAEVCYKTKRQTDRDSFFNFFNKNKINILF